MKFCVSRLLLSVWWLATPGYSHAEAGETAGALIRGATTPEAAVSGAPLAIRWTLGERWMYRMDVHQQHRAKVPQMPKPMEQEVEMGLTYAVDVLTETDDGGRELELEFIAQEMDVTVGEQSVLSYDSKDAATGRTQDPLTQALRQVVGSKIRIQTRPDGQVDTLKNFAAWRTGVLEKAPDMARQMFDQTFHEGYIRELVNLGFGMPGKVLPLGGSWSVQQAVPAGPLGEVQLNSQNTLRGYVEREKTRCAVIDLKGTLSTGTGGAPGPMGVVTIEKGAREGTLWLDLARGRVLESTNHETMQIRGTFPGGGGGFTSQIQQTVRVKLVDTGAVGR